MATVIDNTVAPNKRRAGDGELKRRLLEHLEMTKRFSDVLRVTQVSDHQFRVNTLSPVKGEDTVVPMYRITKSQFLHVETRTGELVIKDQTRER